MGCQVNAKCLDCGKIFTIDKGGGLKFHLVRCDRCGRAKSIVFDDLGELHLQYLKGLSGPYSIPDIYSEDFIQRLSNVNSISREEYERGIEDYAGNCRCGGNYRLDAPPRCPKCRSANIEEGDIILMYD
jgi:hypothetical protein